MTLGSVLVFLFILWICNRRGKQDDKWTLSPRGQRVAAIKTPLVKVNNGAD